MGGGESLALLGCAAFAAILLGALRYRTLLNPLSVYATTNTLILTVFSGVAATIIDPFNQLRPSAVVSTSMASILHLFGVAAPFVLRGPIPARVFGGIIRLFGLESARPARRFSAVRMTIVILAALAAFSALAVLGGGGILWLTASRTAYQGYRSGAGPFFAMTQWFIAFAFVYYLWSRRPRTLGTMIAAAIFAGLLYFLGSKSNILSLLIVAITYRHFMVRPVPTVLFVVAPVIGFALFLSLQLAQGTAGNLIATVLYFRDYFATTAQFIDRFDELGYAYGGASWSELWFYVPRGLYPEKPFVYGSVRILEVLFPGQAAAGHTAGLLGWSVAYLDFGLAGVALQGISTGIVLRMPYEYYLANRDSFFAFVLMVHLSLWAVWAFVTVPMLLIISVAQAVFFRLVIVRKRPSRVLADTRP